MSEWDNCSNTKRQTLMRSSIKEAINRPSSLIFSLSSTSCMTTELIRFCYRSVTKFAGNTYKEASLGAVLANNKNARRLHNQSHESVEVIMVKTPHLKREN